MPKISNFEVDFQHTPKTTYFFQALVVNILSNFHFFSQSLSFPQVERTTFTKITSII